MEPLNPETAARLWEFSPAVFVLVFVLWSFRDTIKGALSGSNSGLKIVQDNTAALVMLRGEFQANNAKFEEVITIAPGQASMAFDDAQTLQAAQPAFKP